ncbi:MAG: thiamine-phosphate kinase [Candidatus Bathyarchaeota archaeon]
MSRRKLVQRVSDLGERRVIEKIIACLDKPQEMAIPFGDDVSATPISRNRLAILKTDMLVGETDIPPGMTLRKAARKAVVMNISDFAAKGVKPLALLASLGLPRYIPEKDVEEIGKGLNDGVREYGTFLIGGDTGESSCLTICCMVFGTSATGSLILRSGAKPGDILAVTGPFGRTAAGLKILLNGFEVSEDSRRILDAVYRPRARLSEGLALGRTGAVSASIDSSDGLAVSLHELKKMSRLGFTLTDVPIADDVVRFADRVGLDATELALYGGEEYELLITVKPDGWHKAQQAMKKIGCSLTAIGEATARQDIVLIRDNIEKEIPYRGWEHFKSK